MGVLFAAGWVAHGGAVEPYGLGYRSCASATCHGRVAGTAPDWRSSYSLWAARDPHVDAGIVLLQPAGRRIAEALVPGPVASDDDLLAVWRDRCLGCHLTPSFHGTDPVPPVVADFWGGVSCESCHGLASPWIREHTLPKQDGATRSSITAGMNDTQDWLTRTEICARCHVGSRTADGIVRDVNHDLMAAGHPPLRFDMRLYSANLPLHGSSQPDGSQASATARHQSGRWRVLQAVAELSEARRQSHRADASTPWPELADYDCFACHRSLQLIEAPAETPGAARWNPWYLAGLDQSDSALRPGPLSAGRATGPSAARLAVLADERARSAWSQSRLPADQELARRLHEADQVKDWYDAAVWYLGVRAACEDWVAVREVSSDVKQRWDQIPQQVLGLGTADRPGLTPVEFDPDAVRSLAVEWKRMLQLGGRTAVDDVHAGSEREEN